MDALKACISKTLTKHIYIYQFWLVKLYISRLATPSTVNTLKFKQNKINILLDEQENQFAKRNPFFFFFLMNISNGDLSMDRCNNILFKLYSLQQNIINIIIIIIIINSNPYYYYSKHGTERKYRKKCKTDPLTFIVFHFNHLTFSFVNSVL